MSFVTQKPEIDGESIRKLSDDAPLPIHTEHGEKPEIDGKAIRNLAEGAPVGLTSAVAPTTVSSDDTEDKPTEHDDKNLTVASV